MAALPFLPVRLLWQLGPVDERGLSDAPPVVHSIPDLKESDGGQVKGDSSRKAITTQGSFNQVHKETKVQDEELKLEI